MTCIPEIISSQKIAQKVFTTICPYPLQNKSFKFDSQHALKLWATINCIWHNKILLFPQLGPLKCGYF